MIWSFESKGKNKLKNNRNKFQSFNNRTIEGSRVFALKWNKFTMAKSYIIYTYIWTRIKLALIRKSWVTKTAILSS